MRIPPVARFVLACGLFAAWIGYLVYLAATSTKPIIISRPQLLVSEIDVVAEIDDPDKPIIIKKILLARIKDTAMAPGAELLIPNLHDCKRLPRPDENADSVPLDWTGPGEYLLLLHSTPDARGYVVAEIPPSPGYPPRGAARGTPRIYRATGEALEDYRKARQR